MNNDTKPGGKVFDVMRPGSVPAEPTSRPVISTTHGKPVVQDDQFVSTDAVNPRPTLDKHNRISISPIDKEPEEPLHSLAAWTDEENDTPPHQIATAATPETRVQPDASPPRPDTTTESTEPAAESAESTAPTDAPTEDVNKEPLSVEEDEPEELQPIIEPPAITPTPPPAVDPPAFPDTQVVGTLPSSNIPPSELLISHHSKPMGKLFWAGIVLLAIIISLVAINFLLDANIIPTTTLPHTNLL